MSMDMAWWEQALHDHTDRHGPGPGVGGWNLASVMALLNNRTPIPSPRHRISKTPPGLRLTVFDECKGEGVTVPQINALINDLWNVSHADIDRDQMLDALLLLSGAAISILNQTRHIIADQADQYRLAAE